jgi:hypothetical protein
MGFVQPRRARRCHRYFLRITGGSSPAGEHAQIIGAGAGHTLFYQLYKITKFINISILKYPKKYPQILKVPG